MPPPTVDLAQRDTVRLISTGRLKPPVLSPLAANFGALEDLAGLESVTNGRLQAQETGLPGLD
ncbi:MAG: RES domain-containing protein, partial [Methylocystis sp.]